MTRRILFLAVLLAIFRRHKRSTRARLLPYPKKCFTASCPILTAYTPPPRSATRRGICMSSRKAALTSAGLILKFTITPTARPPRACSTRLPAGAMDRRRWLHYIGRSRKYLRFGLLDCDPQCYWRTFRTHAHGARRMEPDRARDFHVSGYLSPGIAEDSAGNFYGTSYNYGSDLRIHIPAGARLQRLDRERDPHLLRRR